MDGETLTIIEVAEYLKVHYNTVYRWIRTGILPAFKLGGRYRITQEAVEKFATVSTTESQEL